MHRRRNQFLRDLVDQRDGSAAREGCKHAKLKVSKIASKANERQTGLPTGLPPASWDS